MGGELRSDLVSGRRKGKANRKKLERFEVKRIGERSKGRLRFERQYRI